MVERDLNVLRRRAHPHCVVCGDTDSAILELSFHLTSGGRVETEFACEAAYQGYSGIVHGGVVSTLLDSAMTHCLFSMGKAGLTAQLTVRFHDTVCVGIPARIQAWCERSSAPLYLLKAEVVQGRRLKATASGKFVEKRNGRAIAMMGG